MNTLMTVGLWVKEVLDCTKRGDDDARAHEIKKCEMIQKLEGLFTGFIMVNVCLKLS